ncbi:hypothetical protein CRENBAI_002970 [Crenichthys baileyi]|uniref:Uncharacterized protein n=1 Tax=Crenichthys baileyi TaxID=28760 RepID=A0AAV9R563_9TELE
MRLLVVLLSGKENRFTRVVETASLLGTFLEHRVRLQGSERVSNNAGCFQTLLIDCALAYGQRSSPDLRTRIQVCSYLLRTQFKLTASWLFDHPAQVIGEPGPPSNELSRKYLHPVLHTILPYSTYNTGSEFLKNHLQVSNSNLSWRDLPPLNSSCVVLPDPASLIPLVVQFPLSVSIVTSWPNNNCLFALDTPSFPFSVQLVISRAWILNPSHSCENKTLKLSESPQCISACGSDQYQKL